MVKKATPEGKILTECCEYLEYMKYDFFRFNNVPVYDSGHFRRFPKWCMKGVSDLIVFERHRISFIELKQPKGVQSADQKKFQAMVERNGFRYYLIRSKAELIAAGF